MSGLIVVIVVAVASAGIFFLSGRGKGAAASPLVTQSGALSWNRREPMTMLFMLVDGDRLRSASLRSMEIASFDPATRSMSLLSIPDNLWVTVPGYGPSRISDAYTDGGARLALLTIESVTHVAIPYYLVMGPAGFRQLVDGFDGLDISVPLDATGQSIGGHTFAAGLQHMDGATALAYVQPSGPNAYTRVASMGRLQQVLLAIKQQGFSGANLDRIPSIVDILAGSVATNFPLGQAQTLASGLGAVPSGHVHVDELDFANRAVSRYGDNLLLPNWQQIQTIAQGLFQLRAGTKMVDVLNGTGMAGQAGQVASWLEQAQVPIRGTGSAPSYSYAHTKVLVRPGSGPVAMRAARAVASLLQAPLSIGSVRTSRAPVALIVGADYQSLTQP